MLNEDLVVGGGGSQNQEGPLGRPGFRSQAAFLPGRKKDIRGSGMTLVFLAMGEK